MVESFASLKSYILQSPIFETVDQFDIEYTEHRINEMVVRDKSIINPWKVVNMDTGEEMVSPETPEATVEILPLDRTAQLTANQEEVYFSM